MVVDLNTDLGEPVVIATAALPWADSPQPGVQRRLLEREGAESGRATSVVRYAPRSAFHGHVHDAGEEFLVLEGVFSDETGDFPAGFYVRNPPGSSHAPHSDGGCTILVKLCQFARDDGAIVRVDTRSAPWERGLAEGISTLPLHSHGTERVALVRWNAGATLPAYATEGGLEAFVLEGALEDARGHYGEGTWLRFPAGAEPVLRAGGPSVAWVKTGHLVRTEEA